MAEWVVIILFICSLLARSLWSPTQDYHPTLKGKIFSAHAQQQQEAVNPPPPCLGHKSTLTLNATVRHTVNTTIFNEIVTSTASARTNKSRVTSSQKNSTVSNHIYTPKLLCVYFKDRLGNQLFMYAGTLGLSMALNRTAVFLNSQLLPRVLNNFTVSAANLTLSQLKNRCGRAKRIHEKQTSAYDKKLTQVLDWRYDYTVGTWLQSYLYFHKYETKIRQAITFSTTIQIQSKKIIQELRHKYPGCTLIGVHIRQGDMASPELRKAGYPVASPAFINKSLSYFTQRFNNCVFVVGSDSLQWYRDNFPKGYTLHYLAGNEPAVDMQTLALTDHVVTSFGTFSWWIGFLNRGTTVYMKDFLIRETLVGNFLSADAKDYVYPGWIPL